MGARRSQAGYTLIEVAIAATLGVLVVTKVAMFLGQARDIQRTEGTAMEVEAQARRVLDRVAYSIMGANRETLLPMLDPDVHTTQVRYEYSLGVQDGEVLWSDPELVGLSADGRSVRWAQNPDTGFERSIRWTNLVRPVLEGELDNGLDDNLNGLEDEEGLHFLIDGPKVTIRLSLESVDQEGVPYIHTATTTVMCRNLVGDDE